MSKIIPAACITGERLIVPREMIGGREMDDKELAAIRERREDFLNEAMLDPDVCSNRVFDLINSDLWRMLAEVDRLRGELERAHLESCRALGESEAQDEKLIQAEHDLQQSQAREGALKDALEWCANELDIATGYVRTAGSKAFADTCSAALRKARKTLSDTQANATQRIVAAARELHEVAELRGDNDLPAPPDDPKLWTSRMQDAWRELADALTAGEGGNADA